MQIISIDNQNELNNFASKQKHSQFLQAWQWGEFHKIVSDGSWRIGVQDDSGETVAVLTIIKKNLPMGKNYFYCPRGPIVKDEIRRMKDKLENALNSLFTEARKIAKAEGAMFLRIEPIFEIADLNISLNKTLDIQPSKTSILDLSRSEDAILKNMHQKTRYNIRLASKKDLKFISAGKERFGDFWKLMNETGTRDNFRLHGRNYYEAMLDLDPEFIKLLLIEYKGKVIAANIVSFFGDTVTYMHGGSSNEDRNLMAPYLLQWETIKLAKKKGYKHYDFYGVDEERWPGVTRFKKGFGGDKVSYPGTFDLAFDAGWYNVYKMVRKVRRTF